MNKLLSAVTSASMMLCAGVVSASAQGLPAGAVPPVYGSVWAAQQVQSRNLNASPMDASLSKSWPVAVSDMAKQDGHSSAATVRGG